MKRTKAFTLIELLVVIAIIAILAAILFPVFNKAKIAAKRAGDQANMGAIHQALELYRADQGGYPPLLLQATEYVGGLPRNVSAVKRGYLFSSRISNVDTFKSVLNPAGQSQVITAFWPNADPRPLGGGEVAGMRQAYANVPVLYSHLGIDPTVITGGLFTSASATRFYAWDTYDVSPVPAAGGGIQYELRYCLFWTGFGQAGGDPNDNPRQMGYNDPADDTVVTWNSSYRLYDTGSVSPRRLRQDLVLFRNGSVKPSDSRDVYERSWRFGQ